MNERRIDDPWAGSADILGDLEKIAALDATFNCRPSFPPAFLNRRDYADVKAGRKLLAFNMALTPEQLDAVSKRLADML